MVLHQHDGIRLFDEVPTFLGDLQNTIVFDILAQQLMHQGLTDDGGPILLIMITASAKEFVILLLGCFDVTCQFTDEQFSNMFGLKELLGVHYSFKNQFHILFAVELFLGIAAVVTRTAVILLILLTKIMEQQTVAADC